jgi:hypothetical protein
LVLGHEIRREAHEDVLFTGRAEPRGAARVRGDDERKVAVAAEEREPRVARRERHERVAA